MANRYAIASGNYSNPAIWDGGTTIPSSVDVVRPSGFTITVDGEFTASQFRNDASSPALAGGRFEFTNGSSLTATNSSGFLIAYYAEMLRFNLSIGNSATINGNISCGLRNGAYSLSHSGGGTLTLNGNISCYAGSVSSWQAISFGGSGIFNINGYVSGSGASGGYGSDVLTHSGSGTLNIVGNVYNDTMTSWNNKAIIFSGSGNLNITGNVIGANSGSPSFGGAPTITHAGIGTITVIGGIYGGTVSFGHAIYGTSSGMTKLIGNIYAGNANAYNVYW